MTYTSRIGYNSRMGRGAVSAAGSGSGINVVISQNSRNLIINVGTLTGYVLGSSINITVQQGVYVWADSIRLAALTVTGGSPLDTVTLFNYGYIMGQGGNGGGSGGGSLGAGIPGGNINSDRGGPAIELRRNMSLDNRSYIGGGGGGGGGAVGLTNNGCPGGGGAGGGRGGGLSTVYPGAAGGGIGAVGGNGSGYQTASSSAGGGGRIFPGVGGIGGGTNATTNRQATGGGAGGGGGFAYVGYSGFKRGGNGGSNNAAGSNLGNDGVALNLGGGGGGGWGAAGGRGAWGIGDRDLDLPGGAGGLAVLKNRNVLTVITEGNLWGAVLDAIPA